MLFFGTLRSVDCRQLLFYPEESFTQRW